MMSGRGRQPSIHNTPPDPTLMLPSVLLTAMADVTIDFVTDVTYDTVKRLKRANSYPPY